MNVLKPDEGGSRSPRRRRAPVGQSTRGLRSSLDRCRFSLVILKGPATGLEIPLSQARLTIGRGPGVDIALDDPNVARAHLAIQFSEGGFHVRALADDREVRVNGREVVLARLESGDRIQFGDDVLQFTRTERTGTRRAQSLSRGPGAE